MAKAVFVIVVNTNNETAKKDVILCTQETAKGKERHVTYFYVQSQS